MPHRTVVRIWGSRGSIACPDRAAGRFGGNTACVEILIGSDRRIILDAGTGIRLLGNRPEDEPDRETAILLTHYHWDHIHGLPFYKPLYAPERSVTIYGPALNDCDLASRLRGEMGGIYFPVSMEAFRAVIALHSVQAETCLAVMGIKVCAWATRHPSTTLAYRIHLDDKTLVYAPDNEITPEECEEGLTGKAQALSEFVSGADLLIHDAAYLRGIYESRRGWGHSSGWSLGKAMANANVGKVLLFHHDPDSDDEMVDENHREFRAALGTAGAATESEPAAEGMCFELARGKCAAVV